MKNLMAELYPNTQNQIRATLRKHGRCRGTRLVIERAHKGLYGDVNKAARELGVAIENHNHMM